MKLSIRKRKNCSGYHAVQLVLGTGQRVPVGKVRPMGMEVWVGERGAVADPTDRAITQDGNS